MSERVALGQSPGWLGASAGPQALRLRRTAKRLRDLTARLAQAESRHARMAGFELGFLWFDPVGQVKL
ncbi:hypothetical protein [Microvirga lotononidis]|uniref:hypothetical protein n=1 Tax=Microvirga lotononidis TaxID=864069 RepID=UPI0003134ECB|nr:hypothetical protein [Microvirga lotononidis]WQO29998.1 hypothetical protein U0023_26705 [Microvirga lotononidis]WQO30039.1 hypothetical protein U0023_26995 [Microvirga lotononidis]WQO30190.1 hypothetical protein U0023_28105 [Microvirga lotononidis]WQO30199.1 hypothetical protein U0023_28175 [Microvirga lotononidis]WQO30284.1 hypothetical protein U0023_28775 [Microvirga lotononidis]